MSNNRGQTLLEMVVVIAVALLVVSSLTFATISSIRNAQFAKNQVQATKFAQDGIEKVRSLRDRNTPGGVNYTYVVGGVGQTTSSFADLWTISLANTCSTPCYFVFNSFGNLIGPKNATDFEDLHNGFKRQIQLSDGASWPVEKTITTLVLWNDFSGDHQSQLTTILRKQ